MRENHFNFAALIIVALAAPVAALLFVVALVMWLAELMGSLVYPCLILGLFFALLAAIIYKVSLRDAMREVDERLSVIYEVTRLLREGIEWIMLLLFKSRS
ncbi:MAG: hypothetical protein J6J57_01555 [Alistipes sp.]|nr:hypothetical protein [Alistipes sp.]